MPISPEKHHLPQTKAEWKNLGVFLEKDLPAITPEKIPDLTYDYLNYLLNLQSSENYGWLAENCCALIKKTNPWVYQGIPSPTLKIKIPETRLENQLQMGVRQATQGQCSLALYQSPEDEHAGNRDFLLLGLKINSAPDTPLELPLVLPIYSPELAIKQLARISRTFRRAFDIYNLPDLFPFLKIKIVKWLDSQPAIDRNLQEAPLISSTMSLNKWLEYFSELPIPTTNLVTATVGSFSEEHRRALLGGKVGLTAFGYQIQAGSVIISKQLDANLITFQQAQEFHDQLTTGFVLQQMALALYSHAFHEFVLPVSEIIIDHLKIMNESQSPDFKLESVLAAIPLSALVCLETNIGKPIKEYLTS